MDFVVILHILNFWIVDSGCFYWEVNNQRHLINKLNPYKCLISVLHMRALRISLVQYLMKHCLNQLKTKQVRVEGRWGGVGGWGGVFPCK